jgi:hypothetical protein
MTFQLKMFCFWLVIGLLTSCSTTVETEETIPGLSMPMTIDGFQIRIIEVVPMASLGNFVLEEGFHFISVRAEVTEGSAEELAMWELSLRDDEDRIYPKLASGWGVFYGGATAAGWDFAVPVDKRELWLVIDADTSIDISSLLVLAEEPQ